MAALLLLGTVAAVGAHAPSLVGSPARLSTAASSASPPSASTQAVTPAAGTVGACGAGTDGPGAVAASVAPAVAHPSLLYNSQVEPYATLTGPYAYVAAGAALRDLGYGVVNLTWPGAPSTSSLVAAYMIWSIMDDGLPPAYGTLNGVNVTGTWTAYASPSPCWSPTYIYTFVAVVTSEVENGNNTLSGFPSGITSGADPWASAEVDPMDEGVSLIAVYATDSSAIQQVTVYTGANTQSGGGTLQATLNYETTDSPEATTTYIVADGQLPGNAAVWNGTTIDANAFPGSDPKDTSIPWSFGNLSDTRTFQVPVEVGSDSTVAGMYPSGGDCFTWVGQVLSVGVPPSPPPYSVQFSEQGLNNGTTWSVTTNGTTLSGTVADAASTISFPLGNGTYTYTVARVPGYIADRTGTFQVDGGTVYLRVLFHEVLYDVNVTETGLPSYAEWFVAVTNSTQGVDQNLTGESGTTIAYSLGNGTYLATPGDTDLYLPVPISDEVTVAGSAVSVTITFQPPPLFDVTFVARGLPAGTTWHLETYTNWGDFYNVSTTDSVVLQLPNATAGSDEAYPEPVSGYQAPAPVFFGVSAAPETFDLNYTTLYTVNFTETGLPANTDWSAYLYGSVETYVADGFAATISTLAPNGTYSFSINPLWGYTAEPASGTVTVSGSNVTQAIVFVPQPDYAMNFTETGLVAGTNWSIELFLPDGSSVLHWSTTSMISFQEPNGSYDFDVGSILGYLPSPDYGYVTVAGASVTEPIAFAELFSVTFTETGLPSGDYWYAELGESYEASTSASTTLEATNGTYEYYLPEVGVFEPTPSSGSVTVNGSNVSIAVVYSSPTTPTYRVTFTEDGLPAGTNWSVVLDEYNEWSQSPAINFTEENGSFEFFAGSVSGYSAVPSSGTVEVDGANASQTISYSPASTTFSVTFTESGLPTGTEWWVNISGGPSLASTGTTATTTLPNGDYDYGVATANKSFSAEAGTFGVDGAAVQVSVPFAPVTYLVTFTETGLPVGTEWWVNLTSVVSLSATTSSSSTSLGNGSYAYTVATANKDYAAEGGRVAIAGAAASVRLTFLPVTFAVTVTESGLPSGTPWWFNITGGPDLGSTPATVGTALLNGSYDFTAGTTDKAFAAEAGSFEVDGTSVSVSVAFLPVTYTVTFTESGLPTGTQWWVNISGETPLDSATATITVALSNGTYAFAAAAAGRLFTAHDAATTVDGRGVAVSVTFTSNSGTTSGSGASQFLGLPGYDGYLILTAVAAALLALLLLFVGRRRRKKPTQAVPAPAGSPGGTSPPGAP